MKKTIFFLGLLFILSFFDINNDGVTEPYLLSDNFALAFIKNKDVYSLNLYEIENKKWNKISTADKFITATVIDGHKKKTYYGKILTAGRNFGGKSISASGIFENNEIKFPFFLKISTGSNGILKISVEVENKDYNANNIFFSFALPLNLEKSDTPYLFSPGVFYKDNMPVPLASSEMNIPDLEKLKKDKMLTFLANRPMLPLIAVNNGKYNLFFAADESSTVSKEKIRNSLGWEINDGKIYSQLLTHGFLTNRYVGPGMWEKVNKMTDNKLFPKGATLKTKIYLKIGKGNTLNLFTQFKSFKSIFNKNDEHTVYEDMVSSFKTKMNMLSKLYNEKDGSYSQVANNKDNVVTAWVGGVPAGYGLLRIGNIANNKALEEKARGFLNFLSSNSLSPSGFTYPYYEKNTWSVNGWWIGPYLKGIPARMPSESTFYFLKAYLFEKKQRISHTSWLKSALSNLNAITAIWENNHDFGYSYNDKDLTLEKKGTSAGILWIGALTLGYEATGNKKYLEIAKESGDYYAKEFIDKGLLYGAELDQGFSPDASTAAHALTSFVLLYEATGDKKYLNTAKHATDIFSTFVFSYNLPFAKNSEAGKKNWTSLGMTTSGVRNNHLTASCWPGFSDYLLKLYNYSNDPYYLSLASDIYKTSLEGYSRSDHDFGNIPGMPPVEEGYGFDWILHSDWGGERVSFGGIMHTGMFHQIYVVGANWPDSYDAFGDIIVDYNIKKSISLNSSTSEFIIPLKLTNSYIIKVNNVSSDKLKVFFKNYPSGEYSVWVGSSFFGKINLQENDQSIVIQNPQSYTVIYLSKI